MLNMAALGPLYYCFYDIIVYGCPQKYTKIGIYSDEFGLNWWFCFEDLELDDVYKQHWYIGCPAKCILKSTNFFLLLWRGHHLHSCRVKIIDTDTFPSNKYREHLLIHGYNQVLWSWINLGFNKNVLRFFPGFVLNHQKKNGSLAIGVHESWVFNHGHLRTLMVGSLPFDGIKWELEDQRAAMGCWSHDPYVYGASMRIRGICISGWFACPILGILDITL